MSKKQGDKVLLVPGPSGWEIWKRLPDGGSERVTDDGPILVGELDSLPNGELAMLFPVRSVHALPFKAPTVEKELFEDLANMHAERLGVRADAMAGELTDSFLISQDEDSSTLLHVVVASPGDGELPKRTPKEFDLSSRALPVEGDAVSLWKELGRWVFSIHVGGELIYSQATSSSDAAPDRDVMREIQFSMGQLMLQGFVISPEKIHLWAPEGELADLGALKGAFDVPVVASTRPDPVMPEPPSRILPADVHAARRARAKRNQMFMIGAGVALLYLGAAAWLVWGLLGGMSEEKKLRKVLNAKGNPDIAYAEHKARWDELAPVVEQSYSPLEVMLGVAESIPKSSGLRLTTADINFEDEPEIKLIGTAPQAQPVSSFGLALTRKPAFRWLYWDDPPAQKKQKGWEFIFSAVIKEEPTVE